MAACWRPRRIDHRARFRFTTSIDSETSPHTRLNDAGLGQTFFGYLVKSRLAPTVLAKRVRTQRMDVLTDLDQALVFIFGSYRLGVTYATQCHQHHCPQAVPLPTCTHLIVPS